MCVLIFMSMCVCPSFITIQNLNAVPLCTFNNTTYYPVVSLSSTYIQQLYVNFPVRMRVGVVALMNAHVQLDGKEICVSTVSR